MISCQRCRNTDSGPKAFLLTCRGCSRSWHHRCHMPAVEDDQLIQLIRATNAGDTANDLSSWICRRCKKGTPVTPSSTSSRESTSSSMSRVDNKSTVPGLRVATPSTANVTSTTDVGRIKRESSAMAVDARLANDASLPAAERMQSAMKPSAANQPHVQLLPGPPRDEDVQMRDVISAKLMSWEKRYPQRPSPPRSYQTKAARKLGSSVSATSPEDDFEMQVDSPSSFESTSRASNPPSSTGTDSSAEPPPHTRAASSTDERGLEVRPIVNQAVADEVYDDPEDLYGPPVERRIIRILPSLAEELKEQQQRVVAEKEKRRVPLAPDWIYARHVNDALWKDIPTQGQKRRKAAARKLEDNGLNVNELLGHFMVQNWVREHKK